MNGNSGINGNGHEECKSGSLNNDVSLNGKLPFGKSNNSEHNTFSPKISSEVNKMASNGNSTQPDEQAECNFVYVTRRYSMML